MENYNISCVIVTFNRKTLLKRCLDAVNAQSFKPTSVYILDNASTDGTMDDVKSWGYYNSEKDGIKWCYILNEKNGGGAGGFYKGMKTAFETESPDALWVMDDDGQPDKNCLENLIPYLTEHDYIAPIVLSDEDKKLCSFTRHFNRLEDFAKARCAHDGIIDDFSSPFNGILYSSKLIKKVSYPKKELFIWGDEVNYHHRCKKAGFTPITVLSAIHYHPLNRQNYVLYKWGEVIDVNSDWKLYCMLRNMSYNNIQGDNKVRAIARTFKCATLYNNYYKEKGTSKTCVIIKAVFAGLFSIFAGEKVYMK